MTYKRKEVIGKATLYLGDCMEVMPLLDKVDAVVTDPPYGIIHNYGLNKGTNGNTTKGFNYGDLKDGKELNKKIIHCIDLACKLAKQNIFTFCGTSQLSYIEEVIFNNNFTPKLYTWNKTCFAPSPPNGKFASAVELAVYGYKPKSYFGDKNGHRKNYYLSDTYRHGIRADEKVNHPTQKWLPLIKYIVETFVPDNGVCLDPFMGSGSTGVAAVQMGRDFIGIELDEEYFNIACKRIEDAQRQGDMFV